jgi:hypothetical protein
MFDNTASGAALANAWELTRLISGATEQPLDPAYGLEG